MSRLMLCSDACVAGADLQLATIYLCPARQTAVDTEWQCTTWSRICVSAGHAQEVPCYTGVGCGSGYVGALATVLACCSMPNTFSYRPSVGSEACLSCYGKRCWHFRSRCALFYHCRVWMGAEYQRNKSRSSDWTAVEGETISLTLYFTKNDPPNEIRFRFFIETGGTATSM